MIAYFKAVTIAIDKFLIRKVSSKNKKIQNSNITFYYWTLGNQMAQFYSKRNKKHFKRFFLLQFDNNFNFAISAMEKNISILQLCFFFFYFISFLPSAIRELFHLLPISDFSHSYINIILFCAKFLVT